MLRVLIAEDEMSELDWLTNHIDTYYGDRLEVVASVSNGKDALEKGLEINPDVAFLDIQMPVKTGLEVAKELKKHDRHISIVFLTAHSNFEYAKEALKIGDVDYLLKPYDIKEIRVLVDRLIPKINEDMGEEIKKIVNHMSTSSSKATENPVVRLAMNYIQKHYHEKISLEMLSEDIGFSSSYVSKCLVKHLNKNFNTILLETRCKEAVKLLSVDRLTVNEIAYKVGFSDPNYFGKCFKSYFGDSPKAYSNKLMGKTNS